MTVKNLIDLLETLPQDEEIFIWRGNGHTDFDYTSDIKISRPYGDCQTNLGLTIRPLIIGHKRKKH